MFFFFNDTAPTEIYTLSLHDALPIWRRARRTRADPEPAAGRDGWLRPALDRDPDGGLEPTRHPRPGVAPARPVRPSGRRRPSRPRGPQGDPPRPRAWQDARLQLRYYRLHAAKIG